MSDHDHHHPSDHQPHVLPLSIYAGVGMGLIILTIATVWTAKFMPELIFEFTNMRLDPTLSILLAMFIAFLKASMVCFFFMHLKYDAPFNRAVFFSGLFFCAFFFIFTLGDTLTRDEETNIEIQNEHTPEEFKGISQKTRLDAEKHYGKGGKRRIFTSSHMLHLLV